MRVTERGDPIEARSLLDAGDHRPHRALVPKDDVTDEVVGRECGRLQTQKPMGRAHPGGVGGCLLGHFSRPDEQRQPIGMTGRGDIEGSKNTTSESARNW